MTNKKIKALKAVILVAVTVVFCSCGKPKDLKYGLITNVSVKNMSLTGVDVEATIPIENPNGYELKVQDADMDLSADSRAIAHLTQLYPVTIPGKSKGDYKVGASIRLANTGSIMAIVNLMNGKNNLNLDGTLKVKSFVFTKTVQVHQANIQDYLKPVMDKMRLF